MVLAACGVVGLVPELGALDFAINSPSDVVGLPINGVGVCVCNGVGYIQVETVVIYQD